MTAQPVNARVRRDDRARCHQPARRDTRGAFTLVELLVVIGIIAVLVAMLMPALTRVRQTAAQTVCLSNMRQIGVAIMTYVSESRGTLPNGMSPGSDLTTRWYGSKSIGKYFGVTDANVGTITSKLLICPENIQLVRWAGQPTYTMNVEVMGGAMSHGTKFRPGPTAKDIWYRSTFWRKPSLKVVLLDGKPDPNGNTYANTQYYLFPYTTGSTTDLRHRGGVNALFLDGHAEKFARPNNDWRTNNRPYSQQQLVGRNFQGEFDGWYPGTRIGKLPGD